MQKVLRKNVSLLIAVMLMAVSALTPAAGINAFAAGSSFVPAVESNFVPNSWANDLRLTDLADGNGVKLECDHNGVGMRQGWNIAYPLDGLYLELSGLYNQTGEASLLIYLSSTTSGNLDPGVDTCGTDYGLLALDTIDGELRFENTGAEYDGTKTRIRKDGTVLIKDDLLKYSSLAGRDFTVSFAKGENGYEVALNADGETVTGNLTDEMLSSLTKLNDLSNVYIGIGNNNGNNGWTSIEINEIGTLSGPENAVINLIDELSKMSDEELLYSGNVMRSARAAYDALDAGTQQLVTNSGELSAAEERYQRAADAADSGLVIMNTAHTRFTQAKAYGETGYNSYLGPIAVTDNPEGGVHIDFPRDNGLVGNIEAYASNVNLDGVKLQFDNFVTNGGNYMAGQMAVIFGNGEQGMPGFNDSLALVFNPNTGRLYAIYGQGTSLNNIDGNIIIESELLKGPNLENRRFSLSLRVNPEDTYTDESGNVYNGYIAEVEISGQKLEGVIPYKGGLEYVSQIWATDNVTAALSLATPYGNGGTRGYTVDWIGVDPGSVNGKKGNHMLDGSNAAVENGLVDQGYVLLDKSDGNLEFTVKSDEAEIRLMGYSNSSAVNVYVDGAKTETLSITKFQDKWFRLFENLDSDVEHTVRIENAHGSFVSVSGIYISKIGDINEDGYVNAVDTAVMRKYLLGVENSGIVLERADLSGNDGVIDIRDYIRLKKLTAGAEEVINNASLMPLYYKTGPDDVDEGNAPEWTKDLIIGEVNLRTATSEGTIQAADCVLEHYAEMGVNGIWITPVFDGGVSGNGYGNIGINTIDPSLTGTDNYEEGWAVLKNFIDKAHSLNIRIILDIVFRGIEKDSPLYEAHPQWFTEDSQYGNYRFLWEEPSVNGEIAEWYTDNIVAIAEKTGCDGFRYDMMPAAVSACDIPVEKNIVDALHKAGFYPFIMSESVNDRNGLYATETVSINEALSYEYYKNPYDIFLGRYDISDFIRSGSTALNGCGSYKYYTYSLANHDFKTTMINGRRLAVGYQAIFSPFIPVIYLGEEWNNPHNSKVSYDSALYYNNIDWSALDNEENRAFYEDIKMMIRIRRLYSDIFNIDAEIFKDSNICKVTAVGSGISPYARFAGNRAAIIVPNNKETSYNVNITVSLEDIGLSEYNDFTVTDAETGKMILSGTAADIDNITVEVSAMDQRVLLITAE